MRATGAAVALLLAALFAVAHGAAGDSLLANETWYDASCDPGWTELQDVERPLIANLSYDAFGSWLLDSAVTTPNISCDITTIQDYTLYVNTVCQRGPDWDILLTATFTCFYNDTPYSLPLDNPDAVLSDVVLLEAQLSLDSPDATTDDSVQVANVTTLQAFETFDPASAEYDDYGSPLSI